MKEKTGKELVQEFENLNKDLHRLYLVIQDKTYLYKLLYIVIGRNHGYWEFNPQKEPTLSREPNNNEKDFIDIFYNIIKIKTHIKDRLSERHIFRLVGIWLKS